MHRISSLVACWGLAGSRVVDLQPYAENAVISEPFEPTPLSQLQKTLEPLHGLLLAKPAPWLSAGKDSAPGKDAKKKAKAKTGSNVRTLNYLENVAKSNGVRFAGGYKRLSDMPVIDTPEVAFMGKSNVGKSSALNTLAGVKDKNKLAKVGKTPGRTRMINIFEVGNACNFADLPGYGFAKVDDEMVQEWGRTMTTYLKDRPNLKLGIVLVDVTRDPDQLDANLIGLLEEIGLPYIVVATKVDKLSGDLTEKLELLQEELELEEGQPMPFSSRTGEGRKALWQTITKAIEA